MISSSIMTSPPPSGNCNDRSFDHHVPPAAFGT
jgi:hypothetical protein